MIAVIRLRSGIKVRKEIEDTLRILKLNHVNSLSILSDKKEILGMIKKVENFVTWGEISDELKEQLNEKTRLKSPKGGLKSIKKFYPKGDLGYRGEAINDLIKRMI